MNEIAEWLEKYLVPIATVFVAVMTYLTFYRKSKPHIAVYYQVSLRQQSFIELVIENIGEGTAFDVVFSQPLPVNWFGIEKPDPRSRGGYLPVEGIPSLVPGQRLVFTGGQYAGLLQKLPETVDLEVRYKFEPPLWCEATGSDSSKIGIKHFCSTATTQSLDQAVVDAISGTNRTTIRDIRDALNRIHENLAAISGKEERDAERHARDD